MKKILLTVALCSSLFAQFSIKNWSVKAVGPSASRPATCSVNKDVFICSGSGCSPDPSLEYCTAANAYTAFSGGGSGTVTSVDAGNGVETVSGSAITATGTIRGAIAVNAQTGTSYTILTGDRGKLITHSNGSAIAVTLPQAGVSFPVGWFTYVQNLGAGTVTITPTTSTIDGAASLALTTNQGTIIVSDGSNYFTMRGIGNAGSGTVTSVATTSPITGGTITGSGTIACATCVTSAASLTSDLPVIGGGGQATSVGTRSGNTTQYVTTTGTQTSGDCVKIDANGNHVANGSACGSGSATPANYSQSFTAQTSVSLTHALGTANVIVSCYDGSDVRIEPNSVTIAGSAPYAVTVTFTAAQTGRCVVNGGSGGNSTTTGTFASNPGTCTDGDIRMPSDSVYLLRCASNVWVPWGTLSRMYDPALASITTQVNYGSSTTTTNQGGIILKVPAGSGTQVRGLEKSVPSAPYSITAVFNVMITNQDYMTCGVYLSDGTKFVTVALAYSSFLGTAGPVFRIAKWASTTSFTGDYLTTYSTAGLTSNGDLTVKIEDDNTNRKIYTCLDPAGAHCMQMNSVTRTDYLTPTKAGIFCNSENTTYDARIWLKSWLEQ